MVLAPNVKTAALSSGAQIPVNGFGTWKSTPDQTEAAVKAALDVGYRHIDCAAIYANESYIGKAMSEWMTEHDVPRSEIFLTSKLWNTCHNPENVLAACQQTLSDLKTDYLDLYLMHFPFAFKYTGLPINGDNFLPKDSDGNIEWGGVSIQDTWRAMEDLVDRGLVRNIGVSNYNVALLTDLMQYARIKPVVNQSECHVYNSREELRSVCEFFGLHFTMYSALGSGKSGPMQDDKVTSIANAHSATPAQVLLAWGMANGCSVLSKSSNADRIAANFKAAELELTKDEVASLNLLDRQQMVCSMNEYWGFPSHA